MDKLYSKTALAAKAIYCTLLAPLYLIISSLLTIEDGFLHIIATVIPIGCLFTVPFWISAVYLRKYRVSGIFRYVLFDVAFCLAPAVLSSLMVEIIYSLAIEITEVSGIVTLIFGIVYLCISFVFWFIYLILNKIK
ncbi:MAG: hypothetical protein IJB49_00570 [Clostridia bacterium]|nr:hypothetical protein [Clostridia bacterium]